LDIVVEDLVIIEIKAVQNLLPVHEAQLFSYLKSGNKPVGLLINFHISVLKNGLKRLRN
jgi:GxxExxY protein